MLLAFFAML